MHKTNRRGMRKTLLLLLLIVGAIAIAGCTTSQNEIEEEDTTNYFLPEIKILDDGTVIQRTPDEILTADFASEAPYNTYFLNADARGCNSCHDDLAETLAEMPGMPYEHTDLRSLQGIEVTVEMCLDCHVPENYGLINNSFGTVIHGIHSSTDRVACMSCHTASENNVVDETNVLGLNSSMPLWDAVKHQQMKGIIDIPEEEMNESFAFRQDETVPANDLFALQFHYSESDFAREAHIKNDDPRDDEVFNNWTFTISGEVEQEKTWTLPELIEKAPSETVPMKLNCQINMIGGPLIGQVMVTGIPLEWIYDQAGLKDTAVSVITADPAGELVGWNLEGHEDSKAYLVYEMDGERLSWKNGYPCMVMIGGTSSATYTKQLVDLWVSDEETFEWVGYADENGVRYAAPNVGLFNLKEGQIIKTGESFKFHGYADAMDKNVVAVEISMDRGETWKRFETANTNNNQWVTWTYDFAPDSDGAYCIYLRSVADDGSVTPDPLKKMVIAKSDIPEVGQDENNN